MTRDKEIDMDGVFDNNTGDVRHFCQVLKNRMSESRWQHSLGVAETARSLAGYWGADPEKAWLSGIFHDYARELPEPQLLKLAVEYGLPVLKVEKENPVVLHAPVGALLVQKDFGITDEEILSAIAKHTVGGESLTLLDKIIFLADMVEPGRSWQGVEKLRHLIYRDLDRTLIEALDGTIRYLQEHHQEVHPLTRALWQQVAGRNGE
jgi:predicted HD superfamily hydrolase involved in NAD metabolism